MDFNVGANARPMFQPVPAAISGTLGVTGLVTARTANQHGQAPTVASGEHAQSVATPLLDPHHWIRKESAMNTVFLPRRLPDERSADEDPLKCNFGDTGALRSFANVNQDILPSRAHRMLEAWNDAFQPDSVRLCEVWKGLETGDTFPIHLPAQNAALTFTLLRGELVQVCGYDIQPTAEKVTSSTGPLVASQPRIAVTVPAETCFSQTMAEQVCALQRHVFVEPKVAGQQPGPFLQATCNVVSSKYVFAWLFSALAVLGERSRTPPSAVQKKVRDVVQFPKKRNNGSVPWRRHAAWLALKFVLHATLTNDEGPAAGALLYKAAMLKFMTEFLRGELQPDDDAVKQMLAKVANRSHKLSALLQQSPGVPPQLVDQCKSAMHEAANVIDRANRRLSERWQKVPANLRRQSQLPAISIVSRHGDQTVLPLKASKDRVKALLGSSGSKADVFSGEMEKHANAAGMPQLASDLWSYSKEGRLIGLHAWEEEILQLWDSRDSFPLSTTQALEYMNQYNSNMIYSADNSNSQPIYSSSDAISASRRILVAAVLMALCDLSATREIPMLRLHKPDIDAASLEGILTTTPQEMLVLLGVERHFKERQKSAEMDGPLQRNVSAMSLSVQYAQTSKTMQDLLTELLRKDEQKEEIHVLKVKKELEKVQSDEIRLRKMSCEKVTEKHWNYNSKRSERLVHSPSCSRCALVRDLDSRTHTVFERQLPPDHACRHAAVFEVLVPATIQQWRDCTMIFNESFLLSLSFENRWGNQKDTKKAWVNHLSGRSPTGQVTLSSTYYSFCMVSHNLRVATWADFVKPCQMDCNLANAKRAVLMPSVECQRDKVKELCTFKTKCDSLQPYVTSSDHQQSDVIAGQHACPQFFSTGEFVTFGSVRSGHRLQWFNILRGIHRRTLLLHRREVAQLVAQSVWQAGRNERDAALRDAHRPCRDPAFVREFTAELGRVLAMVEGNWTHYWSLFSIVVLADRLLSLFRQIGPDDPPEDVVEGLMKILAGCRVVATDWLDRIRSLAEEVNDAQDLQSAAAHVSAVGVLTYQHSVQLQPAADSRALFHWLKFVTDLQASTVLNQSRAAGFLETLFNQALRIAFTNHESMLQLFTSRTVAGKHAEFEEFLNEFYTPGASSSSYSIEESDQLWVNCWWQTENGGREYVQLDLRQGKCWINGLPPGRLPPSLTSTKFFSRHFRTTVFTVKPCRSPHDQRAQTTRAVANDDALLQSGAAALSGYLPATQPSRIGPFIFSSHDRSGNEQICIYESRSDGRTLLLLDPSWFVSGGHNFDIPALMVQDHSFWIDIESSEIFLRPVYFRDKDFSHLERCEYVLDFRRQQLSVRPGASVGVLPGSLMLSSKSQIGRQILAVVQRIELHRYVEMWIDGTGNFLIRLPRLGLSFFVEEDDHSRSIRSGDYRGWCVDVDQSLGTMLGLRNGLVLVQHKGTGIEERCLLLPHGNPEFVPLPRSHADSLEREDSPSPPLEYEDSPPLEHEDSPPLECDDSQTLKREVRVSLGSLAEPAIFRFVLDSHLGQLKAPQSHCAWFYLALLHGMTSSVHVDPFTGITGTEMSMCILQSARCWSSSPLEEQSLRWLCRLARCSPVRRYYPKNLKVMETVAWPLSLPSQCASDGYILLVDQIISSSQAVQFLYPGRPTETEEDILKNIRELSSRRLNRRAYLRSCDSLPLLSRLNTEHKVLIHQPSPAFDPLPSLDVPSWETAHRIIYVRGAARPFSMEEIEEELLRKLEGTSAFDDKMFDEDFGENEEANRLSACSGWDGVDLSPSFIAVHGFVDAHKEAHRLWLALLLSFWSYQKQKSTIESFLVNLLAALANMPDKAPRPALRCFPSPGIAFPQGFEASVFIPSFSSYAKSQGLHRPSADDELASLLYESKREELLKTYKLRCTSVKATVEEDIAAASTLVACAPYAESYHDSMPYNFEKLVPFQPTWGDIIEVKAYQDSFKQCLSGTNSSNILRLYASKIHRAAALEFPAPAVENCTACPVKNRFTNYIQLRNVTADSDSRSSQHAVNEFTARQLSGQSASTLSQSFEKVRGIQRHLQRADDPIAKDFAEDLDSSIKAALTQDQQQRHTYHKDLEKYVLDSLQTVSAEHDECKRSVELALANWAGEPSLRALLSCGLLTRAVPLAFLPTLLPHAPSAPGLLLERMADSCADLIRRLLVSTVTVQRWTRLRRLQLAEESDSLQRELANAPPHATWPPGAHVEWLLFELENDLCIRATQVAVAEQMMSPPGEKHAVMQLNMGEGKTSVILPAVAAELADGNTLVRVIVLTSLHNTNFQQLVFRLGGLLGHRAYALPFRRDIPLRAEQAASLRAFLSRARRDRSVMVTVREHVLSLAVKRQEACYKGNDALAAELSTLMADEQRYGRDVIDEADEVLHHRFQLVYPLGDEQKPDGGELRWKLAETVLEAVKQEVARVQVQFGTTVDCRPASAQAFPFVRIQPSPDEPKAYQELCRRVVRFVFAGHARLTPAVFMDEVRSLGDDQKVSLEEFVLAEELTGPNASNFAELPLSKNIRRAMLCLRGILASGVLLLALKKRYRVEYGLVATTNVGQRRNNSSRHIRMAVPFRAKDVAAERTEFGHPDVAILLTVLSYYQQGLTDDQMDLVLDKLRMKEARKDIYSAWVDFAGSAAVDASIRSFDGINRNDPTQMRLFLYPFLKYHMDAINFFVNQVIFPSEAKEFPSKLVVNGWTMTSETRQMKVTGFSGTNDTRHLLPGSTEQRDLPELKHTNARVCGLLLRPENNNYHVLPAGLNGRKLLDAIVSRDTETHPNALIDVGAVILDLTNRQAAEYWLSRRHDKQAVVYFDDENQLRVQDHRSRRSRRLELSAFAGNLSECLVYLDHAHCRGTDLRMADGTLAAVTLGKSLRRDQLVQACMRLRRLGGTHSIGFWAPAAIDRQVRRACSVAPHGRVQHKHVLRWCFMNSVSATTLGFYSWASQGLTHLRTENALRGISTDNLSATGRACAKPDRVSLADMYGQVQALRPIPDIISERAGRVHSAERLVEHCRRFVPRVLRIAQELDEEQEREMEQELEEETQRQLPPPSKPIEETLSPALRAVATRDVSLTAFQFASIGQPIWQCLQGTALKSTSFFSLLGSMPWGNPEIRATESFRNTIVVESYAGPGDQFLRPVEWLLLIPGPTAGRKMLLLLSPFEANELVKLDHEQTLSKALSLLMYASIGYKQQSVMSDWSCTLAGPSLSPLPRAEPHLRELFAELLCFSGGLFFGAETEERLATMRALAKVFDLQPDPEEAGDEPVHRRKQVGFLQFDQQAWDPIMFLRHVLLALRTAESLEHSDMGSLLLRHAWPRRIDGVSCSRAAQSCPVAPPCSGSPARKRRR